ncbi:MAG: hypothetical protein LC128_01760 [Chitinophagales bacterium]|nr:hypothetical protein [Chitinophagales bacterium]
MIFLAVTLGFFAENFREHQVEHKMEKQYMQSLAEDLNTDRLQSQKLEVQLQNLIARLDSLSDEFNRTHDGNPPFIAFKQLSQSIGFPDYIYTDRTMQQLKNAGGMRLIRNLKVADSIVHYDVMVRRGLGHQELLNSIYMPRLFDKINSLVNVSVLNKLTAGIHPDSDTSIFKSTLLLSHEKPELIKFSNQIIDYRLSINILFTYVRNNSEMATRLLSLINKEYHLK